MPLIYLDHAATAPVLPSVLNAMLPWYRGENVGNANSVHTQGINAKKAIENARKHVAELINADPEEIFFTTSGSEANAMWIKCLHNRKFFIGAVEHNSLYQALPKADDCELLLSDCNGVVDLEYLDLKLDQAKHQKKNQVVSTMWVNNELGYIKPKKEIGEICQRHGALLHTDAVQAVGHVNVDVKATNVQYLSLAGHKFGAPLGVGALFVSKHTPNYSVMSDSKGTPNVPGIVGLGAAACDVSYILSDVLKSKHWETLRHVFITTLDRLIPGEFRVNGGDDVTANIISLTIPGVNAETLMGYLDRKDIYVSTGSACNSSSSVPSRVLTSIGFSEEDAMSTIRISMGYKTELEDMISVAQAISTSVKAIKIFH